MILTPLDSFPLSPEPPVRSSPLVTPLAGGERPDPLSEAVGLFNGFAISAAAWLLGFTIVALWGAIGLDWIGAW